MKKDHKTQALCNGVTINHCDKSLIDNANKSRIPFFNDIMLVLLQILTGVGALMTLVSILCLEIESVYVYSCVIATSILYTVVFKSVKKRRPLVFVGVLLLAVIFLGFKFNDVINGFTYLYDQGTTTICKYMYFDLPVLSYEWSDALLGYTNLAICLFAVIYMCLISYFIVVKINFLAIFLLTFPCFEVGAAFGCVPNYYYFSLMLASWAAALVLHQANNVKITDVSDDKKKKKKRVFNSNYVRFAGSSLIIAAITVGIFLGSRNTLNTLGLGRTEDVDQLRTQVKAEADSLWDYIMGEDKDGSMKDGQLLKVDDHNVKFRHHLTMETSLQEIEQPLYLKGFSGTVYDGTSWKQTENYDKYKDLFKKMNDNEFDTQEVVSNLLYTTDNYDQYEAANITLSDFRRSKDYGYYLYNSAFDDNYTFVHDYTVTPYNPKEYSFNAFLKMEYMFDIDSSEIFHADYFKDIQKEYQEFAKKEYTISSATEKVKDVVNSFEKRNTYALVDEVRDYLRKNIKYTFIVDKSPENVDFVENFMFVTKRGYSTHFATAAAVMLQSAGVPTRYVEGYCVLPQIFNELETKQKYGYITVDVTDAYAHAWIEIYDKNYGWIPVDVTPTFYNGSFEEFMKQFVDLDSPEKPVQEEEEIEEEIEEEQVGIVGEVEQEEEQNTESQQEASGSIEVTFSSFLIICIALGLLFVLSITCLVIVISYLLSTASRNKKLNKGNPKSRINSAYLYLLKIGKEIGVNTSFSSYGELGENLTQRFSDIASFNAQEIISIITKSWFSDTDTTEEDADSVVGFVRFYAYIAYKTIKNPEIIKHEPPVKKFRRIIRLLKNIKSIYKAFKFKYIKHLI